MSRISLPEWPDKPALFLDLDGTLLEFAPDPAAVEVPERLAPILEQLLTITGGALAFVSGRTVSELDRLLGHGRYPLAAVHGLERRTADGRLLSSARDQTVLDRIRRMLQDVSEQYPDLLLENKDSSFALHYRQHPDLAEALTRELECRLDEIGADFLLMRGNMVLEIKPDTENKGTAIEAFMNESPFQGRTPVFIGDDVTDEYGFESVNRLGGVSVKVGDGASQAQFRLHDSAAVIDWLDLVARESQQ